MCLDPIVIQGCATNIKSVRLLVKVKVVAKLIRARGCMSINSSLPLLAIRNNRSLKGFYSWSSYMSSLFLTFCSYNPRECRAAVLTVNPVNVLHTHTYLGDEVLLVSAD